jgi:hypothetical protein
LISFSREDPRKIWSNFPRNCMKGCDHNGIPIECGFLGKNKDVLV